MKIKKISGIQKKYLTYIMLLLILALFLSCIGVWSYVRNDMAAVIVDKYEFMNEKMGMSMDNLYKNSNEATAECIINDDVQKSLRTKGLEGVERYALGKYFAYVDLDYITEYCYVDNKKNVYTKSYSKISYDDFEKSGFSDILSDEYSKTEWFWTKDTLFGTEKEALFVGRYVRSMDYAHEPGMLFFKMDPRFLESVLKDAEGSEKEAVTGIVDKMVLVYKCGQEKLNNLYYQVKEQRRCSAWRKTKNPTPRNSSSRSWICTMPEELRIHNWNVNMA